MVGEEPTRQRKQRRKKRKRSQPGSERKLWRQSKGLRSREQRSRASSREGKPGQAFGFYLNCDTEKSLAKFSNDFLVAKSNGHVSILNRPCLLLEALSQDHVPGVPTLASARVSLGSFPGGSALGHPLPLHTSSQGPHQTPAEVTVHRAELPELSSAHVPLLQAPDIYTKTSHNLWHLDLGVPWHLKSSKTKLISSTSTLLPAKPGARDANRSAAQAEHPSKSSFCF